MEIGIPVIEGFSQHMARCQRASAGNRVSGVWEGPPRMICTLGWRVSDHRAIASSWGEVLKSAREVETRDDQILNHLAPLDSHSVWGDVHLGVAQDPRQVPSPPLVSPGCQPTC